MKKVIKILFVVLLVCAIGSIYSGCKKKPPTEVEVKKPEVPAEKPPETKAEKPPAAKKKPAVPSTAKVDPFAPVGSGWKETQKKAEYRIFSKPIPGKDVPQVQMVGIVNATPAACFKVVTDYAKFPENMPYMKLTEVVNSKTVNAHEKINYVFFYVSPPIISARYYTLKLTDQSNETIEGVPGSYKSGWTLVNKGPYHLNPESPQLKGQLKGKKGVETPLNNGYWLFQPIEGGKKSKLVYDVMSDPGGSVPTWMANKAQSQTLPSLFDTITKLATKPSS